MVCHGTCVGDIVPFLKSEQEFGRQYQYGIVVTTIVSRDGIIRAVEIQYQNHRENAKRITNCGVRDLIVIHPIDEIGISKELQEFARHMRIKIHCLHLLNIGLNI